MFAFSSVGRVGRVDGVDEVVGRKLQCFAMRVIEY